MVRLSRGERRPPNQCMARGPRNAEPWFAERRGFGACQFGDRRVDSRRGSLLLTILAKLPAIRGCDARQGMNYRHHFHAGNFADVMKHALLVQLVKALQKKEKGFLYLDTHAGRGSYDLQVAAKGDSLEREPEYPQGIGRLWARLDLPAAVAEYVELVKKFDRDRGNDSASPRYYPGSPWIAQLLTRPQDRLVLCEKHAEEHELLDIEFGRQGNVQVRAMDGYAAPRALLPPMERRALVLIDPPFEAQDEFARVAKAVGEGLRRLPSAVFAIWYPLTERARIDAFFAELLALQLPPALELELAIAGERSLRKMKGCGLVIINPPWQFDAEAKRILDFLGQALGQEAGAGARCRWLVPE
ncbi:MAG: rRNA ((2030)-N(6))-methyltransferase RlmJ [Verrucomicrobia bacterium]|nr:rRNA ((2030)-N(6))-methyltransferase RlmJ [Verrucomicrobiota bacterium]